MSDVPVPTVDELETPSWAINFGRAMAKVELIRKEGASFDDLEITNAVLYPAWYIAMIFPSDSPKLKDVLVEFLCIDAKDPAELSQDVRRTMQAYGLDIGLLGQWESQGSSAKAAINYWKLTQENAKIRRTIPRAIGGTARRVVRVKHVLVVMALLAMAYGYLNAIEAPQKLMVYASRSMGA